MVLLPFLTKPSDNQALKIIGRGASFPILHYKIDTLLQLRVFVTFEEAEGAVEKSVYNYNHLRPHMSCGYLTPVLAHQSEHPLKKHWKPKVYKRSKVVRDQGQFG